MIRLRSIVRERRPSRQMWLGRELGDVPVRSRASVGASPEAGPLLVDEYDTTVVVRPGWTARREPVTDALVLEAPE